MLYLLVTIKTYVSIITRGNDFVNRLKVFNVIILLLRLAKKRKNE